LNPFLHRNILTAGLFYMARSHFLGLDLANLAPVETFWSQGFGEKLMVF
jgi:hypothetical protein